MIRCPEVTELQQLNGGIRTRLFPSLFCHPQCLKITPLMVPNWLQQIQSPHPRTKCSPLFLG